MLEPIEVRALPGYRLHIRYTDGVTGEVDLAHLVGKGVFSLWSDPYEFEKVHLAPGGGIAWGKDVDLCPDSLYMAITAKSAEEVFSDLMSQQEKRTI